MKKLTSIASALVVMTAFGITTFGSYAVAAPDFAKIEARKNQKSQAVGEKVGKAIGKAYELYGQEKLNEAIAALNGVESSNTFDQAYLNRFLGNMWATKDEKKAIGYLQKAVAPDVLGFTDHAAALRLLADLQLSDKQFNQAIKTYNQWLDFTGEKDGNVYLRIASAYMETKQYAKVIEPADLAIAAQDPAKPNAGPYTLKFSAYYELKNNKKAIEVLETTVKLFPSEKRWWTYLAQFYSLEEQYEKALVTLEVANKQGMLETENEYKLLAQLYANANVPYKAASILEKHVKSGLIKKEKNILNSMASSFQNSRDMVKAAQYYGESAKLDNDGDAYRRQGSSLILAEKYSEAVTALNNAINAGVKNQGQVYLSLVEAYFYQNKFREAYQAVQKVKSDSKLGRQAAAWESYIKERASKKGINL
ncbi:tetratricopeptide repeat protein [Rheinheimera sp.]|uniref:tetratricopeptide repeat protein n=1 Tax=Rheinheimera sp. TaxID=1869214 RepID=UPI00307E66C4